MHLSHEAAGDPKAYHNNAHAPGPGCGCVPTLTGFIGQFSFIPLPDVQ